MMTRLWPAAFMQSVMTEAGQHDNVDNGGRPSWAPLSCSAPFIRVVLESCCRVNCTWPWLRSTYYEIDRPSFFRYLLYWHIRMDRSETAMHVYTKVSIEHVVYSAGLQLFANTEVPDPGAQTWMPEVVSQVLMTMFDSRVPNVNSIIKVWPERWLNLA